MTSEKHTEDRRVDGHVCERTPTQRRTGDKTTNTHVHIYNHGESVGGTLTSGSEVEPSSVPFVPFPSVSWSPEAAFSWGLNWSSTGSGAVNYESACCFRKSLSRWKNSSVPVQDESAGTSSDSSSRR